VRSAPRWTIRPATLYGLAVIGHAYRLVDPGYEDSRRLIGAIKLSILLMDVIACTLLWHLVRGIAGREAGRAAALFYWLNPAAILDGAVLGYLDPWLAVPVLAALVAARAGAGAWCGAAFGLACIGDRHERPAGVRARLRVCLARARAAPGDVGTGGYSNTNRILTTRAGAVDLHLHHRALPGRSPGEDAASSQARQ
jgi:hypothetical protein